MLRSFFVITATFAYILFIGTPFLILAVLTRNTDTLYRIGMLGARIALRLAGVKLDVRGLRNIPNGRAAVFTPNHQSNCDSPAVVPILPPLLVMAKKEFFRVPVIGRAMRLRGFIPVDRKNREQSSEAVDRAAESLKAGHSFLVFPEGTRSPDGRLQAFKKGAFVMAIKAQVPVIPISISGASRIMQKGKLAIRSGVVCITIHQPIATDGLTIEDRDRLIEKVRSAIRSGLKEEEQ